jgi:hypothetical protein
MTQSVQVGTVSRVQAWRGSLLVLGSGPVTTADLFMGSDTYGWPEPVVPWAPRWGPAPIVTQNVALVPDVIGLPTHAALVSVSSSGLVYVIAGYQNSATVPINSVISQVPAPGTLVRIGTTVSVILSLGSSALPFVVRALTPGEYHGTYYNPGDYFTIQ